MYVLCACIYVRMHARTHMYTYTYPLWMYAAMCFRRVMPSARAPIPSPKTRPSSLLDFSARSSLEITSRINTSLDSLSKHIYHVHSEPFYVCPLRFPSFLTRHDVIYDELPKYFHNISYTTLKHYKHGRNNMFISRGNHEYVKIYISDATL